MNNQSYKAASPLRLKCTRKITTLGPQRLFLRIRILKILIYVVTDMLAHPVQGVMTCGMYNVTPLVTTILNMPDKKLRDGLSSDAMTCGRLSPPNDALLGKLRTALRSRAENIE